MENQRIIPKDHKDMLACLMKFKAALDDQKSKSDNSLPEFYKNVTLSYSKSPQPHYFPVYQGAEMGLICVDLLRCLLLPAHIASH